MLRCRCRVSLGIVVIDALGRHRPAPHTLSWIRASATVAWTPKIPYLAGDLFVDESYREVPISRGSGTQRAQDPGSGVVVKSLLRLHEVERYGRRAVASNSGRMIRTRGLVDAVPCGGLLDQGSKCLRGVGMRTAS
jgi:hypothetical protein